MAPKHTVSILGHLRNAMTDNKHTSEKLSAYIVGTDDAHNSEYIAPCDERRAFISGFSGSAGMAVVTLKDAALWTDARYYQQASSQLGPNWTLMKVGLPDTPTPEAWLGDVLPAGSLVGADPNLLTDERWVEMEVGLLQSSLHLKTVSRNLVDVIWDDQPKPKLDRVRTLTNQHCGKTWQQKVEELRSGFKKNKTCLLIISALDEIAWLLNLRGCDIDFNPVFKAYIILATDKLHLFMNPEKLTSTARDHLQLDSDGLQIQLYDYGDVMSKFEKLVASTEDTPDGNKVSLPFRTSHALVSMVPESRRFQKLSPVSNSKSIKNDTEISCSRESHLRDSAALCCYFYWLESSVSKGETITEVSAAAKLEQFRSEQKNYVSLSFDTISASGRNAAIMHYKPNEESDQPITTEDIYLVDSGAQYLDGTTDVTRTMHFGTPTDHERKCFTLVLKGSIAFHTTVFPKGTFGYQLDALSRQYLWKHGLDYMHGLGHGVGQFLNCHEGPQRISFRQAKIDAPLARGMLVTIEPGYYEDGAFGVRLENCVFVVDAHTQHRFYDKDFYTFDPITLVPFQVKMIEPGLLTDDEIGWLNTYHADVREKTGNVLLAQGHKNVYNWLVKQTMPIG